MSDDGKLVHLLDHPSSNPLMAKTIQLLPRVRNYLAAWPEGETRYVADFRHGAGYHDVRRLVNAGYLTWQKTERGNAGGRVATADRTWIGEHDQLTRTTKRCRKYTGAKVTARVTPYRDLFPWGPTEHALHLERHSPMLVARQAYMRLRGTRNQFYLTRRERWSMPVLLDTHGTVELMHVRRALAVVFGNHDPTWEDRTPLTLDLWMKKFGMPVSLSRGLEAPALLRMLLLELLIEPEFDAKGAFVRFVAVDPEQAAREMEEFYGTGDDPVAKYRAYLDATRPTTV